MWSALDYHTDDANIHACDPVNRSAVPWLCGLGAALCMWGLASPGVANLHPAERPVILVLLLAVAACTGLLCGAVIVRRLQDPHAYLAAATAGSIAGGISGAVYALVMGIAFVGTFGGAPVGWLDALLVVLSYPVFAGLGACIGGLMGACLAVVVAVISSRMTRLHRAG